MTDRASLRERGEAMRQQLFGDDDGAPAIMRTLNTEATFGAIWSRPGLALDDRMVCALAALGAVQRLPKLGRYVGAALDLGLSPRAIVEILIQIGIYAGFAASEECVEAAGKTFAARGVAMPEETAREAAVNRTVLKRTVEAGEAFLQALFTGVSEPQTVYRAGERREDDGSGFLLDRTA